MTKAPPAVTAEFIEEARGNINEWFDVMKRMWT